MESRKRWILKKSDAFCEKLTRIERFRSQMTAMTPTTPSNGLIHTQKTELVEMTSKPRHEGTILLSNVLYLAAIATMMVSSHAVMLAVGILVGRE